jgi:hypothetical protein
VIAAFGVGGVHVIIIKSTGSSAPVGANTTYPDTVIKKATRPSPISQKNLT